MDEIFEALANVYPRRLLITLLDQNPQGEKVYVPEAIHAGEKTIENIKLECYHFHLPRLEESGFIRWEEIQWVMKGPRFDEIQPVLELLQNNSDDLPDDWL